MKTNKILIYAPVNLLRKARFHNCKNVSGFYEHLFLRKPDIGHFNFSSIGLKQ